LRADGYFDDEIFAACAGPVTTSAAFAARGFEMLGIAEVDQRVEAFNRQEDNIAAFTAIAAVGAAILNIFFTPETDSARPALTGADIDFGLIEKMHVGAFRDLVCERLGFAAI
jgi:hypothetical protein